MVVLDINIYKIFIAIFTALFIIEVTQHYSLT